LQNSANRLLALGSLNPMLKQLLELSRDREEAVPFARFSQVLQVALLNRLGSLIAYQSPIDGFFNKFGRHSGRITHQTG
jgi:hypothetical protein